MFGLGENVERRNCGQTRGLMGPRGGFLLLALVAFTENMVPSEEGTESFTVIFVSLFGDSFWEHFGN